MWLLSLDFWQRGMSFRERLEGFQVSFWHAGIEARDLPMPGKRSATEPQCQPSFQVFKSFTVHLSTLEQIERGWGDVCVCV